MAHWITCTEEEFNALPANERKIANSYDVGRVHHYTCGVHGTRPDGTFGKMEADCPHVTDHAFSRAKGPECSEKCWIEKPHYVRATYIGRCLFEREQNGYHDSYFYVIVWDDATQAPKEICFGATAYAGWVGPSIDATPEIVAAYEAYRAVRAAEALAAQKAKEAATPRRGKIVKVVRGRKVPKGTEGEVFWEGRCNYSGKARIGIKTATGEKHFVAAEYCTVVTQ